MIISIIGRMGVGKSYLTSILKKKVNMSTNIKFAQPLYDIQDYVYNRCGLQLTMEKDRKLLQIVGTEWGRNKDANLWTNLWKDSVQLAITHKQLVFNDDCRFLNEAKAVKDMGGVIIKVDGPQRGECVENTRHKSELEIDLIVPDFTIMNWGDHDELDARVETVLLPWLKEKGIKL